MFQYVFVLILILLIVFIITRLNNNNEKFTNDDISYLNNVDVDGDVLCKGNVDVLGTLSANEFAIDDISIDKNKLNELVSLPLINLSSICLTDYNASDQSGVCFTKPDIEKLKSLQSLQASSQGTYIKWED